MKYAFDVHGVLDTHEHFLILCRELIFSNKHDVYIISGQPLDDEMIEFLNGNYLSSIAENHKYFSIETTLLMAGVKSEFRNGSNFFPDDVWNPVKAAICKELQIDVLFDDTEAYAPYFENINTTFCLVK